MTGSAPARLLGRGLPQLGLAGRASWPTDQRRTCRVVR